MGGGGEGAGNPAEGFTSQLLQAKSPAWISLWKLISLSQEGDELASLLLLSQEKISSRQK